MYFLLLWLATYHAQADCPRGYALARAGSFHAQLGSFVSGQPFEQCAVEDKAVTGTPLEILGCYPHTQDPRYLFVRAPAGWKNKCFPDGTVNIQVLASEFERRDRGASPAAAGEECPPPEPSAAAAYSGRSSALVYLLNDINAEAHDVKTVAEIERYHSCLLAGKGNAKRNKAYGDRYRYMIGEAAAVSDVPISLLTCLCGRESMFDLGSVSDRGVKGLCQTTGGVLADVNDWRKKYPSAREEFNAYVAKIGGRIEHPSCAKKDLQLTRDVISRCPSLSFIVASIYLKYGYNRIENNTVAYTKIHWMAHDMDTTATLAGGYNVGMQLMARSLKEQGRENWGRALLAGTCGHFGRAKAEEARGQMMSIRSCLESGNWLDHQGKPLAGEECAQTPAALANQQAKFENYEKSLPIKCP